MPVMMSFHEAL